MASVSRRRRRGARTAPGDDISGYLLWRARHHGPGRLQARRDQHQYPRSAGFRPRRGDRRWFAAGLPASPRTAPRTSSFLDPELIQQVEVIRGPVANTYGSGAIGGVVVFETKDAGDFLKPEETWALSSTLRYETNGEGWTTSTTGAYRFNDAVDVHRQPRLSRLSGLRGRQRRHASAARPSTHSPASSRRPSVRPKTAS